MNATRHVPIRLRLVQVVFLCFPCWINLILFLILFTYLIFPKQPDFLLAIAQVLQKVVFTKHDAEDLLIAHSLLNGEFSKAGIQHFVVFLVVKGPLLYLHLQFFFGQASFQC